MYLHGLNSTHRSFNYIIDRLPEHNAVRINYDSHKSFHEIFFEISDKVASTFADGEEFAVVGHSLGGLMSVYIASVLSSQTTELITISSPLGGSKAANLIQWFPGSPKIIKDITPNSSFILGLKNMTLDIPTLCICSTTGNIRFLGEPNDSIVTVSSQKALKFGEKIEIGANHFEILLHEKTVNLIHKHIFKDV